MSIQFYDPDMYETNWQSTPCWCVTSKQRCNGHCMGISGTSQRLRTPEEYAAIKAQKQLAHDETILAEADAIRARRAADPCLYP